MWQVINTRGDYILKDVCNEFAIARNGVISIANESYDSKTKVYGDIDRYYINYSGERIDPKYNG